MEFDVNIDNTSVFEAGFGKLKYQTHELVFLSILMFLCVIFFISRYNMITVVWHSQRMANFVKIFL